MDKFKNVLDAIEDGTDTIKNITGTVYHAVEGLEYYASEKYQADRRKADRINTFSRFLLIFTIILWAAILITTIVLCATGNDVVLRFLSL